METRELSEEALLDVPGVHALLRATVSNGKVAVDVTEPLRRYLRPGGGGLVLSLGELRRSAEAQLPPESIGDPFALSLEKDPRRSGLGALAPGVPPRRKMAWKDQADRGSGRAGYKFGDLTKSLIKGNLGATEPRALRIVYERAAPASADPSPPTPAAASRPSDATPAAATPAAPSSAAARLRGAVRDYAVLHAAVDDLVGTMRGCGLEVEDPAERPNSEYTWYKLNEWMQVEVLQEFGAFMETEPWYRFPFFGHLRVYFDVLLREFSIVRQKLGARKAGLCMALVTDLVPGLAMALGFAQLEALALPCRMVFTDEYNAAELASQKEELLVSTGLGTPRA